MKVLFTHDHKFFRDSSGIYYSDGQYPYSLWERYLTVFDEVVVAGRVRTLLDQESRQKLNISSGPHVRFVEIPSVNNPLHLFSSRKKAAEILANLLKECDGLIARNSEISRIAAEQAERLNKPWLVEVVYCPFDALWNHGSIQGKIYAPYAFWATKKMVKKAPFALYVTDHFLQSRYPCGGQTISCSDVQLKEADSAVLQMKLQAISKPGKVIRIGMIGALENRIKGIHVALKAIQRVNDMTTSAFEFWVLGGGNVERWINLARDYGIAGKVNFCGTLPHGEAVLHWLDQIDVYIQPSFQEGLPRALAEAMSRACPAIGSTAGGIPELLDFQCLHKPGDNVRLAELICQAIESASWRKKRAIENFHKMEKYSPTLLDQRRRSFWKNFADSVQST